MNELPTPLPGSGAGSRLGLGADHDSELASNLAFALARVEGVGLDRGVLLLIPRVTLDVEACRQMLW